MRTDDRTLVIGVGNDFRRDDAVGLRIARRLRDRSDGRLRVAEVSGDVTLLMELWRPASRVVVVDACAAGGNAGHISHWEGGEVAQAVVRLRGSTHHLGVADVITLSQSLHHAPELVDVYGIEGKDFSFGTDLSPEVAQAAENLSRTLQNLLLTE